MRIPVFCSAATALALLVFTNFPAAGQTPVLNEFAKLLASDGQVEDRFGSAIDLDGDIAVIGAPDDDAHADNIGSAYIFTRDSSGTWAESAKLVPSDGTWGDSFGGTVAVDGDVVVIGARLHDALGDNSGAVYVFTRDSADSWAETTRLTASDGARGDQFGWSVDVNRDTVIVGAIYSDATGSFTGSAYVFVRDDSGTWSEQAKLLPADVARYDEFGSSVAVDEDSALVGAANDDDNGRNSGSAYIFTRSRSGEWTERAKLLAGDGVEKDGFGLSVDLHGDTALIAAPYNGSRAGAVYVFSRDITGSWSQQAKLTASDGAAEDYFGWSVVLDGRVAAAGAHFHSGGVYRGGTVYVFMQNDESWSEVLKLLASDRHMNDVLGSRDALGLSGGTILAGAIGDDNNGRQSGSAYVFDLGLITEVEIDIRPFSRRNWIVPWARGFVPVAILGSTTFDALQVDLASIEFGPGDARPIRWLVWVRDVNRDGFTDLVLLFRVRHTGIRCGDTQASMTGQTYLMERFEGTDSVRTVACR